MCEFCPSVGGSKCVVCGHDHRPAVRTVADVRRSQEGRVTPVTDARPLAARIRQCTSPYFAEGGR